MADQISTIGVIGGAAVIGVGIGIAGINTFLKLQEGLDDAAELQYPRPPPAPPSPPFNPPKPPVPSMPPSHPPPPPPDGVVSSRQRKLSIEDKMMKGPSAVHLAASIHKLSV